MMLVILCCHQERKELYDRSRPSFNPPDFANIDTAFLLVRMFNMMIIVIIIIFIITHVVAFQNNE
jgi:hypothetical protein